jgi:class 3 adenylate cyclase/tetratricopeptide (TPR) repeat protein
MVCSVCGTENASDAKFCKECAATLLGAAPMREHRKTVTVLFCDVTGSTGLGERLDPEAVRSLLGAYFERMKKIVESHGGTVEKFIGDAVMAVFGVPVVHEDDALRACRAAVEMRDELPALGIAGRIGVATGEVVTGTAERLATGDAVNVAARLEQAAEPGEILIGEETYRLVQGTAEVEALEALALRGKADPVPAFRLLAVPGGLSRKNAAPMVGRETELRRLGDAFAQAIHDRSCQLFTVLGSAGVGKSRLVSEFLGGVDATVVVGRCLSYGDGITYWPVAEIVKQFEALRGSSATLASLAGAVEGDGTAGEIAWAFRKLLEEQAAERPLVCVFDDLHWAEETLLDLVEHVADLSRDAPILMLCMARPDLLELRPGWGGGKWNATAVLLEPLDAAETDLLLDELGGVGDELRARIAVASEGNPLFLEEMLALVRESGDEAVVVPPTIQALLAARLDQLDPPERSVLECGAVEGRVFHQGSVIALSGGDVEVPSRLLALVRKELVRPSRSELEEGDAFRFRHLLIRDAAYNGLAKSVRAELHQRFASWLEQHSGSLVEIDEIVGYHLEQAALYASELGRPDEDLAARAGDRLAAAGRRALARGDFAAASTLLGRAAALLRAIRSDIHLEMDLASAVYRDPSRSPTEAGAIMDAAARLADAQANSTHVLLASFLADCYRLVATDEPELEGWDDRARHLIVLLEDANDHLSLMHVWRVYGVSVPNWLGQYEEWTRAAEEANRHAYLAGRAGRGSPASVGLVIGPRPADVALADLDRGMTGPSFRDWELLLRAWLLAMLGRHDEARRLGTEAIERVHEMRGPGLEYMFASIWALGGDHETAARYFRISYDEMERRGQRHNVSAYAPMLARELCFLGRYDEAEPFARTGRELADPRDVLAQTLWRQATALVESGRGNHSDAVTFAREAITFAERTDGLTYQGDAYLDLAEVLDAAGQPDEAQSALNLALDRYDRKKNIAMADEVRARLTQRGTARV